jgi:hypothetical protein
MFDKVGQIESIAPPLPSDNMQAASYSQTGVARDILDRTFCSARLKSVRLARLNAVR